MVARHYFSWKSFTVLLLVVHMKSDKSCRVKNEKQVQTLLTPGYSRHECGIVTFRKLQKLLDAKGKLLHTRMPPFDMKGPAHHEVQQS